MQIRAGKERSERMKGDCGQEQQGGPPVGIVNQPAERPIDMQARQASRGPLCSRLVEEQKPEAGKNKKSNQHCGHTPEAEGGAPLSTRRGRVADWPQ